MSSVSVKYIFKHFKGQDEIKIWRTNVCLSCLGKQNKKKYTLDDNEGYLFFFIMEAKNEKKIDQGQI